MSLSSPPREAARRRRDDVRIKGTSKSNIQVLFFGLRRRLAAFLPAAPLARPLTAKLTASAATFVSAVASTPAACAAAEPSASLGEPLDEPYAAPRCSSTHFNVPGCGGGGPSCMCFAMWADSERTLPPRLPRGYKTSHTPPTRLRFDPAAGLPCRSIARLASRFASACARRRLASCVSLRRRWRRRACVQMRAQGTTGR